MDGPRPHLNVMQPSRVQGRPGECTSPQTVSLTHAYQVIIKDRNMINQKTGTFVVSKCCENLQKLRLWTNYHHFRNFLNFLN